MAEPSGVKVIVLSGCSRAGKSTLARALLKHLGTKTAVWCGQDRYFLHEVRQGVSETVFMALALSQSSSAKPWSPRSNRLKLH